MRYRAMVPTRDHREPRCGSQIIWLRPKAALRSLGLCGLFIRSGER